MIEEPRRPVCYLDKNVFIGAFEGTLDRTLPLPSGMSWVCPDAAGIAAVLKALDA
jgi:hypothetical protein